MAIDAIKFNKWQAEQIDVAINKYELRFYRHINSLGDDIEYYLNNLKRIDNASKSKIDSIIAQMVSVQNTRYADAVSDFIEDASKLALYVADTESLGLGVKALRTVPDAFRTTPIAANGLLFGEHLDNLVDYNNERLVKAIRFGWANKQDVRELTAVIVGTEKARFADGLIQKQKQSSRSAIDTASHHVGQTSKSEVWQANDIYEYRIVATLDARTTPICQSLDGKIQKWGSGVIPPFHYFCRTVIVPEITGKNSFLNIGRTRTSMYGEVDANMNYAEWSKQNRVALMEEKRRMADKANKKARQRRKANKGD